MGRYEKTGIGLPLGDPEMSLVMWLDREDTSDGIVGMLAEAGATVTDYYTATSVFSHHPEDVTSSDASIIAEYRTETGRAYPPLYRVKVVVEVEPLSDAETEAAWKAHQLRGEPIGLDDPE